MDRDNETPGNLKRVVKVGSILDRSYSLEKKNLFRASSNRGSNPRFVVPPSNEIFQKKFTGSRNAQSNKLSGKKVVIDFDYRDFPQKIEEFSGKILLPHSQISHEFSLNARNSFKDAKFPIRRFPSLANNNHVTSKSYDQEILAQTNIQEGSRSKLGEQSAAAKANPFDNDRFDTNTDSEKRLHHEGSFNNGFSEERAKIKNSKELAMLLNVKIDQERLLKKILQSAFSQPSEEKNRFNKRFSQARLNGTRRKDAGSMEILPSTNRGSFPQGVDNVNKSQFSRLESPIPTESVNGKREKPVLPPLKVSGSTSLLYNFISDKVSSQMGSKERYRRKFDLKSQEVSSLARDLLYNGQSKINYTKLLNDTFQPSENIFKDTEESHYETICKLEAKRVQNKKSQHKYDYLMRMDISRKMVPINNAINQYKNFKERIREEKIEAAKRKNTYISVHTYMTAGSGEDENPN